MSNVPQGWRLFGLLLASMAIAICLGLPGVDFRSGPDVERIIFRTIYCTLPCLIAAFLASSLVRLWPSRSTRWLMSNRRYIGLAFAAGMGWHFAFVAYYLRTFGYHLEPQDITLDVIGVLLLLAMTATSFRPFRTKLAPASWRRLHTVAIYTLWLLPSFFYLEDFLRDRDPFYGTLVTALLTVLGVRITGRVFVRKRNSVADVTAVAPSRPQSGN